jgi:hypothetical protein
LQCEHFGVVGIGELRGNDHGREHGGAFDQESRAVGFAFACRVDRGFDFIGSIPARTTKGRSESSSLLFFFVLSPSLSPSPPYVKVNSEECSFHFGGILVQSVEPSAKNKGTNR